MRWDELSPWLFFFDQSARISMVPPPSVVVLPTRRNRRLQNPQEGISVAVCAYYANAIGHRVDQDAVCQREERVFARGISVAVDS
jgi:hypothetical protein